jgi:hypothetical protein
MPQVMAASPGHNAPTAVYMESGAKRTFACAFDWPGWCRSGRSEDGALEALAAARSRYAVVAMEAGIPFPSGAADAVEVVERITGSKNADFGTLGAPIVRDAEPMTEAEADRQVAMLSAAWRVFDRVVAGAPPELRKGPRGGGRDRDRIVDHVLGGEVAYASRLGLRLRQPGLGDGAAILAHREEILRALTARTGVVSGKGWPLRYAARRFAWHVLDHAWEIEDRSFPGSVQSF